MRKVWVLMERQKDSPAVARCKIKAETERLRRKVIANEAALMRGLE